MTAPEYNNFSRRNLNEIFYISFFVFFAFGCTPTDKTTQVMELGIPTLANDVAAGSLLYEEKTVRIRGIVSFEATKNRKKIEIKVPVRNVYMSIYPDELKQQDLSQYKKGESYTFTVYIRKIEEDFSTVSGTYRIIRCTLVE